MAASEQHNSGGAVWRVSVDTGGTFTDCLAVDPGGVTHRAKVLSSGVLRATVVALDGGLTLRAGWLDRPGFLPGAAVAWDGGSARVGRVQVVDGRTVRVEVDGTLTGCAAGDSVEVSTGEEAPVLAARLITGTPVGEALPAMMLRLATTRGTNALLERRGARTAFFVTEGFADLLVIGDQTRPELFTLRVRKPRPLHDVVVEVPERVGADGKVLRALDLEAVRARGREVLASGVRVAAVALTHSWRAPGHERLVRDALLELGFEHVSASSDLGSSLGLLARAETAVVNAYLSPVIDGYLDGVAGALGEGSGLLVMTSAGGLIDRGGFAPKDSLLSGPAGGVVGAAEAGRRAGFGRVISFDMGGTSTDCARCEGMRPERVYQTRVGDARIVAPCVAVETVAAGGGSVCSVDRGELRVGPESAGAEPGPACYGRGGPLTITDCNLLLGRIDPTRFAVPLDREAAEARAAEVLQCARAELSGEGGEGLELASLLAGFVAIADQRMAEAVRRITLRRGHDPGEHALVAFGGAGPQHACAIAGALGVGHIVIPPDAGMLSAFGLAVSPLERVADEQVLRPLEEAIAGLGARLDALESRARGALPDGSGAISAVRTVEVRYLGQDDILEVAAGEPGAVRGLFERRYADTFGYRATETPLELVSARVTVRAGAGEGAAGRASATPRAEVEVSATRRLYAGGVWRDVRSVDRAGLAPGEGVDGPALVTEEHSTTYVAPGWRAETGEEGSVVLVRARNGEGGEGEDGVCRLEACTTTSAVGLELAIGKLTAIAEEMGERLRRTAVSTNVKQRRDFSCALLDAEGRLVVNAPHVPVHLGSMGVCVRAVRERLGADLGHGVVVTNHPAFGGSHLPDVTVIQPVHDGEGVLLGYAAARAHHAEIGGIAPGSMAPEATRLEQEGVVIPPTVLGRPGAPDWALARGLFVAGPYPSRDPETNVRDLAAAVHAVGAGAAGLRRLAEDLGAERFGATGRVIRERAASRLREALSRMPDGVYEHSEPIVDGGPIAVTIEVRGDTARVDFAGSGPVHPRCLNATPAIVTSAVIYVLRLLIDEDLPLNEGLLEPVELLIPEGLLDPTFLSQARECPAVAGGNVEISQMVVEVMLTALGLGAQSHGSMNNVVLGNESFGFYETLGGGCGASARFPGESSVHTHMTNTAITDVEVFEHRYPARIELVRVRLGSGGGGDWPGGDGMERRYRLLARTWVGLLIARTNPPGGKKNAVYAEAGECWVDLGDSLQTPVPNRTLEVPAGSLLCVKTPGGAGIRETTDAVGGTKEQL